MPSNPVLGHIGRTHNVSIHERQFARRTLRLPPRRVILVFSGIDLDTFRPASGDEKRAARESLGLSPDGRLLVTVGREAYEKNYGDLYAALDHVLPDSNWHFAHAGAGSVELRSRLCPDARARVHAFEFLERPENLYHAADGFVLTSRSEAFGLSAYEALACGLPLILSATTGLLSLRKLGFPGVQWLPNPAEAGNISGAISEAVREWSSAQSFDSSVAQPQMRHWFEANAQHAKLVRVYRHSPVGAAKSWMLLRMHAEGHLRSGSSPGRARRLGLRPPGLRFWRGRHARLAYRKSPPRAALVWTAADSIFLRALFCLEWDGTRPHMGDAGRAPGL